MPKSHDGLAAFRRVEDVVESGPVFGERVLRLSDKILRTRVAQQPGQRGQLGFVFRKLVPTGRVHEPNPCLDAPLEPAELFKCIRSVAETSAADLLSNPY